MYMNVLSLFDGISCARVALERCGIPIKSYTAYEIDKYAIQISKKNFPTNIHKGNVKDLKEALDIDLLIGGSPCQDLSIAKKGRKGLDGDRSGLFWEYVRIKELCKPKWFILENVASMSKDAKDTITKALGVEPVMINASLVSAQSRKRLFWTNIKFTMPVDKGILLKDVIQDGEVDEGMTTNGKAFCLDANYYKGSSEEHSKKYKVRTLLKSGRKLTPIECERLQGLPDNYTADISNTQRYKCLGNAFNVDVIASMLTGLCVVAS